MHFFWFFSLCLLPLGLSYKVVVFSPTVGPSHSNFLGKISDILLEAGHNVTLVIPIYRDKEKHLTGTKKVKNIIRIPQDPRICKALQEGNVEEILGKSTWHMNNDFFAVYKVFGVLNHAAGYQCENVFKQTELLGRLEEEQFDLGISESLFICAHAFFERIQVKTIINADSTIFQQSAKIGLGEPSAISYYPGLYATNTDKMSFLGRTQNFFDYQMNKYFLTSRYHHELAHLNKNWEPYWDNVAFNFVNSNRYLDYPSPTLPKTVFVGGMQVTTRTDGKVELSKEWDKVLNRREKNVLISFGSVAQSAMMPEEYKSAFLKVFEAMPDVTFIWKYEEANSTITSHLDNVKLTTWMPQNDLLADQRLSLFITHGGLGSTTELAYQGTPAIVTPIFGDQPRNAHMLTRHGGAIQLEKTQLDQPEVIRNTIETVLNDPSYKENARKLANILDQQPNKPKETVLKHCDFAVTMGNLKTLDSEGKNLNFFVYYSLDLILTGCVATLFIPILFEKEKHLVGSKKVKNIIRVENDPRVLRIMEETKMEEIIRKSSWEMSNDVFSIYKIYDTMNQCAGHQCEYLFQHTELLDALKKEQFDLAISESLYICALPFFERIQVKTIINAVSTIFQHFAKLALGEPAATSYYPDLFSSNTDKMDFLGRVKNFIGFQMGKFFTSTRYQYELDHLGTKWEKYWDKVAFNFVNSNSFLDFPSPTLPKTVFVGGMQVTTKKNGNVKLSQEWEEVLSRKTKNVLISFGSVSYSSRMPDEYKASFLKVFESMPDVTFIWKYEEANSTITSHLDNVKLTTWMPQNDLLADQRLSLFITHGGLGSTTELAYQGKPAIVVPIIGDQPRNARMLERHGGVLLLEKTQLNQPEVIQNSIETVLNDPIYARNAKKLAEILDEQPYKPKDVVLRHCDFAVKFGNLKTLDSEGRNQNLIMYHSLDIILAGCSLITVLFIVAFLLIRLSYRFIRNTTKSKKE